MLDNFYPQASSQWDGLTHVGDYEHGFWGGVTVQELRATGDKKRLGIDHWARRGIAGRCVLLDVARYRAAQGRPIDCGSNDAISVEELEATRAAQGVALEPGDVWLIRTGWVGWYEQQRYRTRLALADRGTFKAPGLACSEAMAEYMFDHHPAAIAATTPRSKLAAAQRARARRLSAPLPARPLRHRDRRDVRARCAGRGLRRRPRYEALFTSAPLNIEGGTGSPANALALK